MLDDSGAESTASSNSAATDEKTAKGRQSSGASKIRRLYGYGAERRSQPKTTDLIPKRWFAYSTVVALLIGAITLFNALAFYSPSLYSYVGDAGVAAFSLQGSGTLASWFASVLLAFAAAFCVQVYYLRKHKCDDYRGSYRLWLWAFAFFAVLSVSATVGLGQITQNVVAATAGALPSIGPISILVVVASVMLTAIAGLATWETRVSRGAISLIASSWLAGLVSILSVEPVVQNQLAETNLIAVASNAWLVFCSCAFLAVLTYARYVYLAANGMLTVRQVESKPVKSQPKKTAPRKAAKPVAKKSTASAAKAKPAIAKTKPTVSKAKPAVVAKPTVEAKPTAATNRMDELRKRAAAKKAAAQSKVAAEQPTIAADSSEETPKLSKADRRRQKKLERRQKRAA